MRTWSVRRWLLILVVVAAFARLALWFAYPLTQNNDSATYVHLANNLINNGFGTYNATRTPGYPVFLALTGNYVYSVQLLLGFLTTLLFFYIGWKLSGRAWLGGLAGLVHTLNIGQLFFEATLLTETLTTFLVTVSLAGTLFAWKHSDFRWRLAAVFLAGVSAGLAAMVRPMFVFMPFLLGLLLLWLDAKPAHRWLLALVAVVPAGSLLAIWVNFVYSHYAILSLDTIGGYRWLNHTGAYFEYVPEKYAALRDTYIHYRNLKIATTGTQTNAAWDALDAMLKVSKLNYFALSRLLTSISMDLIVAHPDLYLQNVFSGWWMFWWAAVYWTASALRLAILAPGITALIYLERGLMILANYLFLAGSLASILWKRIRVRLGMNFFLWFGVASIWISSVVQTLLDHGDNPRYLVPLQSFLLLLVIWWLLQLISSGIFHHETI